MTATASAGSRRAHITAVTSGKGGVGKTFVSANLGAALVRHNQRVLVLDADLGLANLDVVLNLPPRVTLHDVMTGQRPLEDAILPGPGGLSVLLAGSGMVEYSRLTPHVRDEFQHIIEALAPRFDHIVLDTGAGISEVVLYTVSLAEHTLVIVTPEPTSLTDAYATIKVLATVQQRRHIRLLVNQVRRAGEGRAVCTQLQQVIDRYVNLSLDSPVRLELLGEIPLDAAVREAVLRRELLLERQPGAPAARALVDVSGRFLRGLTSR
jgi:flagellar biosynthesis protein FlhG